LSSHNDQWFTVLVQAGVTLRDKVLMNALNVIVRNRVKVLVEDLFLKKVEIVRRHRQEATSTPIQKSKNIQSGIHQSYKEFARALALVRRGVLIMRVRAHANMRMRMRVRVRVGGACVGAAAGGRACARACVCASVRVRAVRAVRAPQGQPA
jgi:hypothetical protein